MDKDEKAKIEAESVFTKENREPKVLVTLGGLAQTASGKMVKSNYFRFLEHNLDDYDHITFTPEEARKINLHLQLMSTGTSAMTPMYCAGSKCQPAGNLIMTSNRGEVPIEELTEEDLLWTYDRRAASIRNSGYKSKIYSKDYEDFLFVINTGTEEYSCTGDHLVIAKWSEAAKNAFCVYLMEKNGSFRIGKSKLFMNSNGRWRFGPGARMKAEKADAIWILEVCSTNTDALLAEEYFSVTWQIPKALYLSTLKYNTKYNGLYKWVTQEQLDHHHSRMKKQRSFYAEKLKDHGLSIESPFQVAEHKRCICNTNKNKYGGNASVFEIPAFNFISLYMEVPVVPNIIKYVGRRKPVEWKTASKERKNFKGKVYSLDVDQHHTYVTNGIITHNCPIADRCPLQKINKAPIGAQCLIEVQLIKDWIMKYFEEFDVDPNNFTEVTYINELADLMVQEMRINIVLSRPENSTFLMDQVIAVDSEGDPIIQKQISPYMELKDRIASRRSKIIKLMVGDRQEKYKKEAALKVRLDSDPSSQMAAMRNKLETLKRELDNVAKAVVQEEKAEKIEPRTLSPEDIISSDE